jgi:hypothetical protein
MRNSSQSSGRRSGRTAPTEDRCSLAYRVVHRVRRWEAGTTPQLDRVSSEGTLPLVL